MSKFCIDLEGMMLPDAIAAVVEAWYEAQNTEVSKVKQHYTIEELQKILNRSRASIYRMLNTGSNAELNPRFDPAKLNHEYRADKADPIRVSSNEIERWKSESQRLKQIADQQKINTSASLESDLNCKDRVLDHVCRLIKAGLLVNGDKMPSLRDLSSRLGMHRNTVAKVYQELEADGVISVKLGSGFYVAEVSKLTIANAI